MLIPLRPDRRMADQPQNDDESSNLDNAGIVAEISTENDVTATLHDGPDGAPHSAPVVALELPHAANARRSSTIFHRKDASSINAAAAAASTVAGAEAGAVGTDAPSQPTERPKAAGPASVSTAASFRAVW